MPQFIYVTSAATGPLPHRPPTGLCAGAEDCSGRREPRV